MISIGDGKCVSMGVRVNGHLKQIDNARIIVGSEQCINFANRAYECCDYANTLDNMKYCKAYTKPTLKVINLARICAFALDEERGE